MWFTDELVMPDHDERGDSKFWKFVDANEKEMAIAVIDASPKTPLCMQIFNKVNDRIEGIENY